MAAALVYDLARNGLQCAVMAPTEILAEQHYRTFTALLDSTGIHVELLTGSLREKEKKEVRARLEDGTCQVAIGTHALISETVRFQNLGLVITDEQHRFGVAQRMALALKGANPHLYVMSATPIPRTLSLIIGIWTSPYWTSVHPGAGRLRLMPSPVHCIRASIIFCAKRSGAAARHISCARWRSRATAPPCCPPPHMLKSCRTAR